MYLDTETLSPGSKAFLSSFLSNHTTIPEVRPSTW